MYFVMKNKIVKISYDCLLEHMKFFLNLYGIIINMRLFDSSKVFHYCIFMSTLCTQAILGTNLSAGKSSCKYSA